MVTRQQTKQKRVVRNINPKEKVLAAEHAHFGSVFWLTWPKYVCNTCWLFHPIYVSPLMYIDEKVPGK